MKKLLFKTAYSLCVLILFITCKNDDLAPDSTRDPKLSITPTDIPAAFTAGTYTLAVTSNIVWTAAVSDDTWCTVAPTTGGGNIAVTINVAEQSVFVQRSTTITFTAGTLTREVTVTQAGVTIELTVNPTTIEATSTTDTYTLNVTSNTDWTAAVSGGTWCAVAPTAGNGNVAVAVNVEGNPTIETRSATVTFTYDTHTRQVGVTQVGTTLPSANTPPNAASTLTWVFGDQTWSDAIHIPECNKPSFTDSYDESHCRSYMEGGNIRYYYNWAYVNQNAVTLCPTPWHVPTRSDFDALVGNTNYTTLINDWGYGGRAAGTAVNAAGSYAFYWSATEFDADKAYNLRYFSTGLGVFYYGKTDGFQVRCVK